VIVKLIVSSIVGFSGVYEIAVISRSGGAAEKVVL
jgi:hypothetical protein